MINISLNVARSQELADQIASFLADGNSIKELAPGESGIFLPESTKQKPSREQIKQQFTRNIHTARERKQQQPKPKVENKNAKRVRENQEARTKAECEGKTTFIAECMHHGMALFRIKYDRHYCTECLLISSKKNDERRKQKRIAARKKAREMV